MAIMHDGTCPRCLMSDATEITGEGTGYVQYECSACDWHWTEDAEDY